MRIPSPRDVSTTSSPDHSPASQAYGDGAAFRTLQGWQPVARHLLIEWHRRRLSHRGDAAVSRPSRRKDTMSASDVTHPTVGLRKPAGGPSIAGTRVLQESRRLSRAQTN